MAFFPLPFYGKVREIKLVGHVTGSRNQSNQVLFLLQLHTLRYIVETSVLLYVLRVTSGCALSSWLLNK